MSTSYPDLLPEKPPSRAFGDLVLALLVVIATATAALAATTEEHRPYTVSLATLTALVAVWFWASRTPKP